MLLPLPFLHSIFLFAVGGRGGGGGGGLTGDERWEVLGRSTQLLRDSSEQSRVTNFRRRLLHL